jgi:hypothetical protein
MSARATDDQRTMLSLDVATTPPGAGRLRMLEIAVGEVPLNRREYSGTPMKLEAFSSPDKSETDGPRDGVAKGFGAEMRAGASAACESLDSGASDHAEATSMILPTTDTSSSCLSACRSCCSSYNVRPQKRLKREKHVKRKRTCSSFAFLLSR